MKKAFLTWSNNIIKTQKTQYSEEKLDEIRYGLENLYLSITKLFIILIVSSLLGILKEFIIFLIFYNIIRLFAFGLHATKSYICLTISMITFITLPYVAHIFTIAFYLKISISLFCLLMIVLYAPADTYKRPLINKKKRFIYKIMAIISSCFYIFFIFYLKDRFLSNALLLALLFEVILILPVTYKVFKLPYNNYKRYHLKEKN